MKNFYKILDNLKIILAMLTLTMLLSSNALAQTLNANSSSSAADAEIAKLKAEYEALPDEVVLVHGAKTIITNYGPVSVSEYQTNPATTKKAQAKARLDAALVAQEREKAKEVDKMILVNSKTEKSQATEKKKSIENEYKQKYGSDWKEKISQEENNVLVLANRELKAANSKIASAEMRQASEKLHEFNKANSGKELTKEEKAEKKALERELKNKEKDWMKNASDADIALYNQYKSQQNLDKSAADYNKWVEEMKEKHGEDWREKVDKNELAQKETALARSSISQSNAIENAAKAQFKGCNPAKSYRNMQGCLFCPLFRIAFNATSVLTSASFYALATPISTLMIMGFAIWLAVTILAFVSELQTRDAKDLVMQMLTKGFIVLFCFIILRTNITQFFSYTIEPIFNTGMNIAQAASNSDGQCSVGTGIKNVKAGLPVSMGTSILCTLEAIQNKIASIVALGQTAICLSWEYRVALIIPQLNLLFTGLGMWIMGLIMIAAFPFLMIDAVLQLGIAGAMLPAAIGAYPFKLTQKYAGKIWNIFMNSMFQFVFLSIIILILTEATATIIMGATEGDLDTLVKYNVGAIDLIIENIGWTSVAWLKIIFIMILTWTILGSGQEYASQFASSMVKGGIGAKIGGMAASAAKTATTATVGKTASFAWDETKAASKGARQLAADQIGRAKIAASSYLANKRGVDEVDANGNKTGWKTFTNWKGQKVSVKNGMVKTKKRNGKSTLRTADMLIKQDAKGNIIKTDIKNFDINRMVNHSGNLEPDYQQFLDNTISNMEPEHQAILLSELNKNILSKKMPGLSEAMVRKETRVFGKKNTLEILGGPTRTTDSNGNTVITVVEVEKKGEQIVARRETKTIINKKGKSYSELSYVDSKGNGRTYSTNGMMQQATKFKANLSANGDVTIDNSSIKTEYALADKYRNSRDYQLEKAHEKNNMNFGYEEDLYSKLADGDEGNFRGIKMSMNAFR